MLRRTMLSSVPIAAASALPWFPAKSADAALVDLLLVLALDASGSISNERITLQREGHARAVASAPFVSAVMDGPHGRVALTLVDWSNSDRQTQAVPWTLIEDEASARHFARAIMRAPRPIPGVTSISGAIDGSVALLARAPYAAERRVIDLCANGTNNDGRPVTAARDDAVAAGVTVNGLPILDVDPELDAYFAREVIGGARAFTVIARDIDSFAEAVLRKLVAEIAAAPPDPFRSAPPFS